ncbi:hypothetical protein PRK78_000702 [Emydomyces testavorans]|uniref:Aminoglycoside phosphotransferase domain-containing protein n=1 Tax=Emydomyces testavorans TaxID=2070801 RepID=A0AAF0IG51_9EURO|nr:hypothetical protein PRK78_000702 [Emydomyces testavorans]
MASSGCPAPGARRIVHESDSTIRKYGTHLRIEREAAAIAFVQKHTTIPTPRILGAGFSDDRDGCWILMSRSSGTNLDRAWPSMSESARKETVSQLKSYLEQLHSILPPNAGWIGSCTGTAAYDHRLNNGFPCGPFVSVAQFLDFLVDPVKRSPKPSLAKTYRAMFSDSCGVNFVHADLSYEHILVDESTGSVMAIIDWEMAGFWPEWWEFRKAVFGGRCQKWWADIVKDIMPSYEKEFEADSILEMF